MLGNSDFQSELEAILSVPQCHVVLKMQPQELPESSSSFWDAVCHGYTLHCFADDSGSFVHFRDFSCGTKTRPDKVLEKIKGAFLRVFDSCSHTEWEFGTFTSLKEAHVYMGWVRS
jgi:hypothetical protein